MFGVSRQVYYRSIKSQKKRKDIAQQVVELVNQIRMELPRAGTRKLYHMLRSELKAMGVGRDRLFAILKANHMLILPKRSYHITTNSHHRFRKHKDLIEQFSFTKPEQVWVADITYIGNRSNPLYLALVTDAYSKKIVGYDVSGSLAISGALKALNMAIKNRKYSHLALIHHSDRGLQYCSNEYQKKLLKSGLICSMTESYDPYANAIAERVNGIIKQEFLLGRTELSLKTMKQLVKQSVKYYNNKRPHYSCYMLTPVQMHRQNHIKIRTYKKKNSSKYELAAVN